MMPRVLLVDNQDSFTWNLAQSLRESGLCSLRVAGYREVTCMMACEFDKVVFSPGPGLPSGKPVMKMLLDKYSGTKSFLGICLGHQAIAEAFGGRLFNLNRVAHGIRQDVRILDASEPLFRGISSPVTVGLYHSWAVDDSGLPPVLRVTARNADGIIMALSHSTLDIKGVQFHPESYMTTSGRKMIQNWLEM